MKENLRDLKLKSSMGSTSRDEEELSRFIGKDPVSVDGAVEIASEQMRIFKFEAVIRPKDKALVLHLKHLPKKLRNAKFFEFATIFFKDKVGKYKTLDVSFIGELDSVNKLNSLDMIFTEYYPAKLGDMNFVKRHTFKIALDLDELIYKELGVYADTVSTKSN